MRKLDFFSQEYEDQITEAKEINQQIEMIQRDENYLDDRKMKKLSAEICENVTSEAMDLECLVCLEVPNGLVYSCQNEHLLCLTCLQVDKCPACRQDFVQLPLKRNTLAEAKIKDLKNESE